MLAVFAAGLVATLSFVTTLAGTAAERAERRIVRAASQFAQGELAGATSALREAVELAPQNPDARKLLGETHFKAGRYSAAAKELQKALRFGALDPDGNAARLLAEALIRSDQVEHARSFIQQQSPTLSPRWLALIGLAEFRAGDYGDAAATLAHAVHAAASDSKAREDAKIPYWLALTQFARSHYEDAFENVKNALALDERNPNYLALLGNVELVRKNIDAAEQVYDHALAISPTAVGARCGKARVAVARNELQRATTLVGTLPTTSTNLCVAFVRALVTAQTGAPENAIGELTRLLNKAPNHQDAMYLLASLKADAEQYHQALEILKALLRVNPQHMPAIQLRATMRDVTKQGGEISVTEKPRPNAIKNVAFDLSLKVIGQPYLDNAVIVVERWLSSETGERRQEIEPLLVALRLQNRTEARRALASLRPSLADSNTALALQVLLLLDEEKHAQASALAAALADASPDSALALALTGECLAAQQKMPASMRSYELALAKDPSSEIAALALARRAVAINERDKATAIYRRLLRGNGGITPAAVSLASLLVADNKHQDALQLLTTAMAVNNDDFRLPLAVALITLEPQWLNLDAAEKALSAATILAREHPAVLHASARLYSAQGNYPEAVSIYERLKILQADSLSVWEELANAYSLAGRTDDLKEVLVDIIAKNPDDLSSLYRLGNIALKNDDIDAARAYSKRLYEKHPFSSEAAVLNGYIRLHEGNHASALAELRAAFQRAPTSEVAIVLHRTESRVHGQSSVLRNWLNEHTHDIAARLALAAELYANGALDDARVEYRNVLELAPDHPEALQQLAKIPPSQGLSQEAARATSLF